MEPNRNSPGADGKAGRRRRRTSGGRAPAAKWSPLLYLPAGRQRRGFLMFSSSPTEEACIELRPAYVRLILALAQAMDDTRRLPPPARGWLSAAQIVKAIADQDDRSIPTEDATIPHYVCEINQLVRDKAVKAGWTAIQGLIEKRDRLGYRLVTDALQVIDGTVSGKAPEAFEDPPRPAAGGNQ